jgi:hypothetical protein
VTTEAVPTGRISAFVRWVARTPWPVFTLGMLQSDIIGALFVLGFLRFGLPPEDRIQLQDLPALNLAVFLSYLFFSFTTGAYLSLRLLIPVMRWQRRDSLLTQSDPGATELARTRALKMPLYRSIISVSNWCLGSIVFIVASWPVASNSAPLSPGHRAGCDSDGNHRVSAIRTGAAAGRRCRASWRGAGELSRSRGRLAAGAHLGVVHRRAGPGDRAGVGGEQISDPHRLRRPTDHTDPDTRHRCTGDRSGRHGAGGHVDR